MPIPEHVRRQAMDAVSQFETVHQIRAFPDSGKDVSAAHAFTYSQPPAAFNRPIPDEVRMKAMDAVSDLETRSQIRLVRDNGEVTAPNTITRQSQFVAAKINRMDYERTEAGGMQKTITKDDFGMEL